jgi:hypothetical protein
MRSGSAKSEPVPQVVFDATKAQATVVGSEIVSFVTGVTAERREAIVNSSLLAQLIAKQAVPDQSRIYDWYDKYFDALANLGWVIQEKGFSEYAEAGTEFDAHSAIIGLATTLLGAAPAALAIVKSALDSLHQMDASSPFITLFNRESQVAKAARFQISVAEQGPDGQFMVTLMAFGLQAKSEVTQVLFFRWRKGDATFQHYDGKVTINTTVLDAVQDELKARLVEHTKSYLRAIPPLV